MSFKYERLPLFCFHCGKILQGDIDCSIKPSHRSEEGVKPWGVWLRAEEPQKRFGSGTEGSYSQDGGWKDDGEPTRKERPAYSRNPSQQSRIREEVSSIFSESFHNKVNS